MARHKLHSAGSIEPKSEVERRIVGEINDLKTLSIAELKAKWTALTNIQPPRFAKRSLLTQLIAWELQAKVFGGLETSLRRRLLALGASFKKAREQTTGVQAVPQLKSGVKLIRSWKGYTHHVTVVAGGFVWQDKTYKSLSVIARNITGTSWSGPVFFGLKKSKPRNLRVDNPLVAEAHG